MVLQENNRTIKMIKRLLVIVPCFNEGQSIGGVLDEIGAVKLPEGIEMSILVVNDCSTDDTLAQASRPGVIVLDLPINLGIGGAMQAGYHYADHQGFDLSVQIDGDGQHPPAELNKLLNHFFLTKANVVIGSRFISKQGFQSSFLRRIGISYFYWLNRLFIGKKFYDSTSGFRLFDCAAIKLAADSYPDEYPEPESLIIFSRKKLIIEEVQVMMRKREAGRSSIQYFQQCYYMFKVSIAMFFSFIRK
jgi:glycosyltransferase involved in cell wall biosynthesis